MSKHYQFLDCNVIRDPITICITPVLLEPFDRSSTYLTSYKSNIIEFYDDN